ncbi:MAG: hypothetical protein H0V85_00985 [Thermoleophilaceae bacterium]|nr:hypothetical protein [Thermoleophilaceae bacterium]
MSPRARRPKVVHHDLCFGCGIANLFGLQIEMEAEAEGGVTGRFFVKQDHQGPPGLAHPGVLGAALEEAMSLALEAKGIGASPQRLEADVVASAPVGMFVILSAAIEGASDGERVEVVAEAALGGSEPRVLARSRGAFAPY